ncbi:hypothetical protein E2986_06268 [Frieseomelitta varia]|uniref:Membrane insertase YidC/Oxa/ALB C-terminal domain-containing protein n=1 Tax=Frieseomelitta varia TaxID=561572 RepID=A0A833S2H9_9HYME|nr:hypothetical protein E2986_06268 [Frieseomelitta varia]
MNVRMFKKIQLHLKCYGNSFMKHSCSIHYVSNGPLNRNLSNTILHQQLYPKILKTPLLCNKSVLTKISNNYPIPANHVRQYSNSGVTIVNDTLRYNNGIFQIISESITVEWVTEAFRFMHYQTGLPWWAGIILTTILSRTFINLPLSILDLHNRAKQQNLKSEMMDIAERTKKKVEREAVLSQLSPARTISLYAREFSKEQKKLYIRENCHPFKTVAIVLLQAPIWISLSVAIRNMCYMLPQIDPATVKDFQELTTGGFGWIQNLTDIDHFFIFPILFGLSNLVVMEINHMLFRVTDSRFSRIYKNFCRILTLCFVPLMSCLPSCLSLFWVTNNLCSISQSLLLLSPKVRRLFRIPKTDVEYRHPYEKLQERLRHIFYLKKSAKV